MSVVTERDIARLDWNRFYEARRSLERAFFNYPLMAYACPDPAKRARGVCSLYGAILRDSLQYGEVFASPAIEGVACWLPPGVRIPKLYREIRCGMLKLPFVMGWPGFGRLVDYGQAHVAMHHRHVTEPHWFLATIGVDPECQGQGIGSALLGAVTRRADARQVRCYLETHREENVRLYEKHGFRVAEICTPAGHPLPVWGMVRDCPPGTPELCTRTENRAIDSNVIPDRGDFGELSRGASAPANSA